MVCFSPSHEELVTRAERWLRNTRGCYVVLTEVTAGIEVPDAIGWKYGGRHSELVECKRTRADFHRDAGKVFRQQHGWIGVGRLRWYLTPPGLLGIHELPSGWGLVECRPRTCKIVRHPAERNAEIYNRWREMTAVLSALAKHQAAVRR